MRRGLIKTHTTFDRERLSPPHVWSDCLQRLCSIWENDWAQRISIPKPLLPPRYAVSSLCFQKKSFKDVNISGKIHSNVYLLFPGSLSIGIKGHLSQGCGLAFCLMFWSPQSDTPPYEVSSFFLKSTDESACVIVSGNPGEVPGSSLLKMHPSVLLWWRVFAPSQLARRHRWVAGRWSDFIQHGCRSVRDDFQNLFRH